MQWSLIFTDSFSYQTPVSFLVAVFKKTIISSGGSKNRFLVEPPLEIIFILAFFEFF
jgi:hypothetical protein